MRVTHPGSYAGAPQSRETGYYAFGLLLRDGPGDRSKAEACLNTILGMQYTDPSKKWYGTFKVVSTEPAPGFSAGQGYDPNWREFVGVTLEMILLEFPDRISGSMRDRLLKAVDMAAVGEQKDGRLIPNYTNPALLYGSLWDFSAAQHHDAADAARASAWMDSVYGIFKARDAFQEFNSPTYYGVDLLGVTLWRQYGSSPHIRSMGADMEAKLWTQIASSYSPDLRNIAGPYDRAYGMDMTNYICLMGVWLRTILPADKAPLPALNPANTYIGDALGTPLIVTLKPEIPADALAELQRPTQPHMMKQQITSKRLATSWIGKDVLFGAEATDPATKVDANSQFRPITVHWKTSTGTVGWIDVSQGEIGAATASSTGITAQNSGDLTFTVSAQGLSNSNFSGQQWRLPGLDLEVSTDGTFAGAKAQGTNFLVTYNNVHHFTMTKH